MKKASIFAIAVLVCLPLIAWLVFNIRPSFDPYASPALAYQSTDPKQPGLQIKFFGTSTLLLSDGQHAILTDGFFSRPSWPKLLLTKFQPDPTAIDAAVSQLGGKVDAIVVAHSQHDHAMDAGIVAQKTGAVLYGSTSTLNIARGQDTPEGQLHAIKTREPWAAGPFRITAFETPHSPEPINPGFIAEPIHSPARLSAYKVAENFSFFVQHPLGNVLVVPSANYTPHTFDGIHADVVVLGIGLLGKQSEAFTTTYWNEVVKKTGAKLVLPIHWDDFARPLQDPLVPLPYLLDNINVTMGRLQKLAAQDGVTIQFLPALQAVKLPAPH